MNIWSWQEVFCLNSFWSSMRSKNSQYSTIVEFKKPEYSLETLLRRLIPRYWRGMNGLVQDTFGIGVMIAFSHMLRWNPFMKNIRKSFHKAIITVLYYKTSFGIKSILMVILFLTLHTSFSISSYEMSLLTISLVSVAFIWYSCLIHIKWL